MTIWDQIDVSVAAGVHLLHGGVMWSSASRRSDGTGAYVAVLVAEVIGGLLLAGCTADLPHPSRPLAGRDIVDNSSACRLLARGYSSGRVLITREATGAELKSWLKTRLDGYSPTQLSRVDVTSDYIVCGLTAKNLSPPGGSTGAVSLILGPLGPEQTLMQDSFSSPRRILALIQELG